MATSAALCPFDPARDDRKSARVADANLTPQAGSRMLSSFAAGRAVLRSPKVRQAGASAAQTSIEDPEQVSFFFLDGDLHRRRRAAVASFFAPKTIVTRYHDVMHRTMDEIVAKLQAKGRAPLDELSFTMAVDVTADIVGLTDSDSSEGLAGRIRAVLDNSMNRRPGRIGTLVFTLGMMLRVGQFYRKDLAPAIAARRGNPREDVISYLVAENYSKKAMIMECLSYGGAGMMTTREFIVMAAWHLFDDEALRTRFLAGPDDDQLAILEEILRLEPVASLLHRAVAEDIPEGVTGETLCINLRAANTDEAITGPCPHALDPDRAKRMKVAGPYMSFGDGPHRCPGAQVALHETRIFLDRLLRLPGIQLESAPEVLWNPHIQGYELRGAVVTADVA
jgi:cytochrome P450